MSQRQKDQKKLEVSSHFVGMKGNAYGNWLRLFQYWLYFLCILFIRSPLGIDWDYFNIDCIFYVSCLSSFVIFAILYGLLGSTITISPWPESQNFIQKWWHCLFFVLKYLDMIWYINEWFSRSDTLASFLAGLESNRMYGAFCSAQCP